MERHYWLSFSIIQQEDKQVFLKHQLFKSIAQSNNQDKELLIYTYSEEYVKEKARLAANNAMVKNHNLLRRALNKE